MGQGENAPLAAPEAGIMIYIALLKQAADNAPGGGALSAPAAPHPTRGSGAPATASDEAVAARLYAPTT